MINYEVSLMCFPVQEPVARQGIISPSTIDPRMLDPDRALVKSLHFRQNSHGGLQQPDIYDVNLCYHACLRHKNCYAFDFDSQHNTCWLHGDVDVCSDVRLNNQTVLYILINCTCEKSFT